jgi:D-alanyl-lipoteichoic acid acyltransferase DltB (MBOAT superfamily)
VLFNSLQYLVFLPLVVAAHWLVPPRLRPALWLLASYYFYMSWLPVYGLLLGGLTLWNYVAGWLLDDQDKRWRRLLFIAAIAGNLGCLALFKYTNFLN